MPSRNLQTYHHRPVLLFRMSSALRIGVVSTADWKGRLRLNALCTNTAQENRPLEKGAFFRRGHSQLCLVTRASDHSTHGVSPKKPVARTGRVMGSRNIARHAAISSVQAPAERTFKEILWILEKVQTYTTGSTRHVLSGHHH